MSLTSLRLTLNGDVRFDLSSPLTGLECSIQNALVNIGQAQGSDPVYPTKGTTLLKIALAGALIDLNTANHASNFAAADTMKFLVAHDYEDVPERIERIVLQPALFTHERLTLDAQLGTNTGKTIGVLASL